MIVKISFSFPLILSSHIFRHFSREVFQKEVICDFANLIFEGHVFMTSCLVMWNPSQNFIISHLMYNTVSCILTIMFLKMKEYVLSITFCLTPNPLSM